MCALLLAVYVYDMLQTPFGVAPLDSWLVNGALPKVEQKCGAPQHQEGKLLEQSIVIVSLAVVMAALMVVCTWSHQFALRALSALSFFSWLLLCTSGHLGCLLARSCTPAHSLGVVISWCCCGSQVWCSQSARTFEPSVRQN